ncbi:MAG TPA: radical SAM protein [Bacteroidales bacterium]|nr:radical SAM protein [Bacteroidales bacterium]HOH83028.1 radical SAM protein [Bacteroidales bacterium]HPB25280.1 radical SAM protein [Bacteroidales bacterium]HPI30366.1 radical SAM protein [Bacteroidales bacterium]HQN15972.1 radical SAM protein [Bacteroidales bacterium]
MKILLVNPPFYRIIGFYNRYFPLALTMLATTLKCAGHEALVYDADLYNTPENMDYSLLPEKYPVFLSSLQDADHPVWAEVKKTISDFCPDLIGISIYTTFAASAFHTAEIAKTIYPDCPVVLGGPHATSKAGEVMQIAPFVDFVVKGAGEKPLLDLANHFQRKEGSLQSIAGLSFRMDGQIIHNPAADTRERISGTSFPDRSLLMNEKSYSSEDMGLIMTTIGCPYNCTFCASHIKKISSREVDNIIEEIKLVKQKYGTTQFAFKDDSFTINKSRVYELCQRLIGEKLHICWECNTRVNLIDEELLRVMKKAGCNYIKIGIESGADKILAKINKGITCEQSRNAAKILRKSGIHWSAYFLIGMLGETKEDMYNTLEFMYELKPDLALLGVYETFPGTKMFDDGLEKNMVKTPMLLEDFYSTLPHLYYIKNPHVRSDQLDEATFIQVVSDIKEKFHRYNKKPRHVIKTALAKTSVYRREPKILLADVRKFFRYI